VPDWAFPEACAERRRFHATIGSRAIPPASAGAGGWYRLRRLPGARP
jgi:hypothetical protein